MVLALESTSAQGDISISEPAFDVTSVKVNTIGSREAGALAFARPIAIEPGRWVVRRAPLRGVIQALYPEYSLPGKIIGGPTWIDETRFDMEGRTAPDTPPAEIMRMAKRLLSDRFQLKLRMDVRPVETYSLVIARDDRRLGPGIRAATDCTRDANYAETGRTPCRLLPMRDNGVLLLKSGAAPISDLVSWLQTRLDRQVVDRTGLSGEFAIRFDAPPGSLLQAMPSGPAPVPVTNPDIFTAVREQLGLRLEPKKDSVSILIIEHVEMPSAN